MEVYLFLKLLNEGRKAELEVRLANAEPRNVSSHEWRLASALKTQLK